MNPVTDSSEKILVSGCSAGLPVSHDGRDRLAPAVRDLLASGRGIALCPEQLGGMTTPRETCEIIGGDGGDVLDARARVMSRGGIDVTGEFLAGAERTLAIARENGCVKAVLKARSPSCGVGIIYAGSFNGELKPGDGVATALLKRSGIEVITDEDFIDDSNT